MPQDLYAVALVIAVAGLAGQKVLVALAKILRSGRGGRSPRFKPRL